MTATISTSQHSIEVTEVGEITVSDIEPDAETGGYVRLIKIYNDQGATSAATLLVQLRVRSATEANLLITAPEQEF